MSAIRQLKTVGHEITGLNPSVLPKVMKKIAFIIINNYIGTSISLGDGPLNDGFNIAKLLKQFGYTVFYVINPKRRNFIAKLDYFLKNTQQELVIYYVGHGNNVPDLNGDEDDGMDEAMGFVDGNVIDDQLVEEISANKNTSSRIVLMSDCCHGGSIWDIQNGQVHGKPLPSNILSVAATNDRQTAKQMYTDRKEQGLFTYNLMKILNSNPKMSPIDCKKKLVGCLRKFGQTVTLASTSPEMLNQPLFTRAN